MPKEKYTVKKIKELLQLIKTVYGVYENDYLLAIFENKKAASCYIEYLLSLKDHNKDKYKIENLPFFTSKTTAPLS